MMAPCPSWEHRQRPLRDLGLRHKAYVFDFWTDMMFQFWLHPLALASVIFTFVLVNGPLLQPAFIVVLHTNNSTIPMIASIAPVIGYELVHWNCLQDQAEE